MVVVGSAVVVVVVVTGSSAGQVPQVLGHLGVNSIDILNFGRETGLKTGPFSGPNSVH